jgi:hypothetical protein
VSRSSDELCDEILGPTAIRHLGDALYAAILDGDQQLLLKGLSERESPAAWSCLVMMLGICVAFDRLLVTQAGKN